MNDDYANASETRINMVDIKTNLQLQYKSPIIVVDERTRRTNLIAITVNPRINLIIIQL